MDYDIEEKSVTEDEIIEPRRFKVILLNDDYSAMEFVIEVLMNIFERPFDEAVNIMLSVHRDGRGACGVYPYDIAETKARQVRERAKAQGYPLRAVLEEA